MATRKLSTLLSFSSRVSIPRRSCGLWERGISRYTTAAASIEEPLTPSMKIEHTQLMINGKFVDAASGKTFPTMDPRTGEVIAQVAEADAEDVNRAVRAARKAFDEGTWPKMTP